ncbi:serine hydrolase domain-containing protein [Leuconostoc miyukkimchii]|uniref:serine hydrolase domain-containing protein n=1 Tax=Leuconostoc miyukkimchii TaxID=910540 RepID=UPI001C7D508E|nr:serine hydrolase domain-containing protein [Leuconostoc miyukkimchii]
MKRIQHKHIKNQLLRRLFVVTLLIIVVWGCSEYLIKQHLVSKTKTVKKVNQPVSNDASHNLERQVFLKNNELSVNFNKQLTDAGFIGTALVVHRNHIILQKGFGYADRSQNQLNDVQSLYQIASLQKSFTATLIMQQVHAGKLSLDTLLSRYYPNVPDANKVTIKEMLTMMSGLKQTIEAKTFTNEAENVLFDANHTTIIGTKKWSYQPINYRLLAGILMQVTHKTYSQLFYETFNQKYHLNISNYNNFMNEQHRTIGYKKTDYSQMAGNNPVAYAVETGTGNMAMSTGELYRYYKMLIDHKILNDKELIALWQPAQGNHYASGLYHYDDYNYGHGIILGFESTVIMTRNGQDAVILLSNEHTTGESWQVLAKKLFTQMTAIKNIK